MTEYKVYKSDNPAWNVVCAMRHCLPDWCGNVITQALSWSQMHEAPPSRDDLTPMGLADDPARHRLFNAAWVAIHDPEACYSDDLIDDPRVATPHMRQAYGAAMALWPSLPAPYNGVVAHAVAAHPISALNPYHGHTSDNDRHSIYGRNRLAAAIWRQVTAALDAEIQRDWPNVMRQVETAERAEQDRGYDR